MYLKINGEKTDEGYTVTIDMDNDIWNFIKPLAKDLLNQLKNPPIQPLSPPNISSIEEILEEILYETED